MTDPDLARRVDQLETEVARLWQRLEGIAAEMVKSIDAIQASIDALHIVRRASPTDPSARAN
jgi:hypothetical protein